MSPMLAVRDGNWKLLCNPDGSDIQLYNLAEDIGETVNCADAHAGIVALLKSKLIAWFEKMPV